MQFPKSIFKKGEMTMKADQIIKNAKIYTADKNQPMAAALAVKDGKFVYVGDEAGLSAYEGPITDLGGKFIMPGLIDSHVHVTWPIGFEYAAIDLLTAEPEGISHNKPKEVFFCGKKMK
jgi:predicted amidohydrolase YtcJ